MSMDVNGFFKQIASQIQIGKNEFAAETRQANNNDNVGLPIRRIVNTNGVTDTDIEEAMTETSPAKAVKMLLEKSPLGMKTQLTDDEVIALGYEAKTSAYHLGAPTIYAKTDGSRITLYNGLGTKEQGEDQKKAIYETDRFKQEMIYDKDGKLTKGTITIKDDFGHIEKQINFTTDENGKIKVTEEMVRG